MKLTKKELQENAERLMKGHGKNKVWATQDGNYFFTSNTALCHNNELKQANTDWDGEIISFEAAAPVEKKAKVEDSQEVKDAKQVVADAETALKVAAAAYTKADKALGKKPDDETAKTNQAEAKTAMENAQVDLDNAKTKLAALQPQV